MIEPFLANGFMLNAFVAGVLVSIACGIVGTLMVLRGLAFIGDALAHGVLPGIAAAVLLGVPGILGAAAGGLLMIGGITLITRKSRLSSDTAIGLSFVGMLALGVVIVSRSNSFTSGDLVHALFGEPLGIGPADIAIQLAATALLALVTFLFRRPFLLLCFNPEQAQASGYNAKRYHVIMLFMVVLTVIVSFQTVGTLLVFGMLIAPAATAALFTRRIGTMMTAAAALGIVSVYTGLIADYHYRLGAGASITLTAAAIFFITLSASRLLRRRADTVLKKPSTPRGGVR